ncbi:methyltransferase [Solihabitans fulvus]|uniref:Methyltransferase n=1 Tax=Solihabitans fulvus TaxID=1892852 RepID=A0A5B2W9Q8_9PSEU|nr:methyltransferase [Solihabitans fulvus]KAA2247286.1 methyltransferase [Solihabitans fulvus]
MSTESETASEQGYRDPRADILQVGLGFCAAKVVLSAVELGVFTLLGTRPLDADQLVAELGLHGRGVRDFLDSLVSLGFLDRDGGKYRNSALAATYLDENRPETYSGGLLELANVQWYETWQHLTTALRTGKPQYEGADRGAGPFEALYGNPELLEKFQRGMTGASLGSILAMAERFPWSRYHTVVDVGCSEGTLLSRVLDRHAHLTGVGFDLADVAPNFAGTVGAFALADRMSFAAGSFFTDPLPSAEVISFGHILHDWDLDTKRMLLRKAYEALPAGGAVVISESLIDDERRHNTFGLLMSLHLLLESPGGFDYTGADCLGWLAEAGFRDCRVEHLVGPESMVVGIKNA